jgi:hypothetical protein
MERKTLEYLYNSFTKLVEEYGFSKVTELNDEQNYSVEYCSTTFGIKLEKYRREFYATLYKSGNPDKEINLFNLLRYLNQDSSNVPEAEYFHRETNLEDCYRKQFDHISTTVYENFAAMNDFFRSENYESKVTDITKFMLNKYPELFKRA